jgi:hypothetical protein
VTTEQLVSLFQAKRKGNGWMARCPAHDDHNASLSITEGRERRTLVYCQAGCELDAVLSAKGLSKRDLFAANGSRSSAWTGEKPKVGDAFRKSKAIMQSTGDSNVRQFDWKSCVEAFTYKQAEHIAKWRGYSIEFLRELRDKKLIGIYDRLIAFAVKKDGLILGAHVRMKNGKWFYEPSGNNAAPLVFGDLVPGDRVNVFESTWDGLAYLDVSGERDGVIITRGSGNAKFAYDLAPKNSTLYLWTQHDEPAEKWQRDIVENTKCCVKRVEIPAQHEDLNDWTRAGATVPDLLHALSNAKTLREPAFSADTPRNADDEAITRLAAMSELEYERARDEEAKKLGCRGSVLDKLVEKQRPRDPGANLQGSAVDMQDVEPWSSDVNGAETLELVAARFCRYVALPVEAADAAALYCATTHCYKAFQHSPRLAITSPEKQCGKTTLRDVVAQFVPRPILTENLTCAVLFRLVDANAQVILADEYDSWIPNNEELRGLLNAGHRKGAMVYRCEGDNNQVRAFAAYAPAVLCGIGALPATLYDRSIVIRLKRAKPNELQARFDSRCLQAEQELCRKLARWSKDNFVRLSELDPKLPETAYNRVADNWRPLFAIAEVAGGDWPERASACFAALTRTDDLDAESLGTMLLSDIADLFGKEQTDKLPSSKIATALAEIEGRPWAEWGKHRRPISPNQIANQLHRFSIAPKVIRVGEETARGYLLEDFQEAFDRYLPDTPFQTVTP